MSDDWRERARCTAAQARLFDPLDVADARAGDGGAARVAQAIAICNTCPVRLPCLDEALTAGDSGIRGGLYLEDGRIKHVVSDRADRRASIVRECTTRKARVR